MERLLPKILPFHSLRAVIDAEYGVILSYGFFKFSEAIIETTKKISPSFPNTTFQEYITFYYDDIISSILFLLLFVIIIDDYIRRRIATSLAPCRSIRRCSFDLLIGLFFLLSILAITEKSIYTFLFLGIGALFSSRWAYRTGLEAKEWEKNPETYNERIKCTVSNWPLYFERIDFIKSSTSFCGSFLIFAFCLMKYYNTLTDIYFNEIILIFAIIAFCFECWRYTIEKLLLLRWCSDNHYTQFGLITTIGWIPRNLKHLLNKVAKVIIKWQT